ncbi:MAG: hypothetical protein ACAH17_03790 [Candidatus Paceibacterota bacterium]
MNVMTHAPPRSGRLSSLWLGTSSAAFAAGSSVTNLGATYFTGIGAGVVAKFGTIDQV